MIARFGYLNSSIMVLLFLCIAQLTYGLAQVAAVAAPEARPLSDAALRLEVISPPADLLVLEQLQERPLFWSSRRPYEPPPVLAEAKPVQAPEKKPDPAETVFKDTRLLGIYAGGQHPGAIFEHKGQRVRLNQKESLEGWALETLNSSWVEFVSDEQHFKLEIQYPSINFTRLPVTD